jgi:hypothetical protein
MPLPDLDALKTRKKSCQCQGVLQNPAIETLRINNQVRMPSSMKTMMLSTCTAKVHGCDNPDKDPKFCSYDRVYMRRRAFATKP